MTRLFEVRHQQCLFGKILSAWSNQKSLKQESRYHSEVLMKMRETEHRGFALKTIFRSWASEKQQKQRLDDVSQLLLKHRSEIKFATVKIILVAWSKLSALNVQTWCHVREISDFRRRALVKMEDCFSRALMVRLITSWAVKSATSPQKQATHKVLKILGTSDKFVHIHFVFREWVHLVTFARKERQQLSQQELVSRELESLLNQREKIRLRQKGINAICLHEKLNEPKVKACTERRVRSTSQNAKIHAETLKESLRPLLAGAGNGNRADSIGVKDVRLQGLSSCSTAEASPCDTAGGSPCDTRSGSPSPSSTDDRGGFF